MTRRDRFTGLLAGTVPLTMVVCDFVTEAYLFSTLALWFCVPSALLVIVWVMWDDKRAQMRARVSAHTDQRRFFDGPEPKLCGCWVNPSDDVVFVVADQLYKCERCGMRWTRLAWDRLTVRIVTNINAEREQS